jgi:hypothetical protein
MDVEDCFGYTEILVDDDFPIPLAIARLNQKGADIRFELLKRMRYGAKRSDKRRNKHNFRHDWLNPITGMLSQSGTVPWPTKHDRRRGNRKPGTHWL